MRRRFWLEIGPLREGQYTGISQVTAGLAGAMLGDATLDGTPLDGTTLNGAGRARGFFFGRAAVPARVVETALTRGEGEWLEFWLARAEPVAPALAADETAIAIFPNVKTCRRGFAVETQIVHDLSALLTPQFHMPETVRFHASAMAADIASNDLTFCVSEATRQDVLRYLAPPEPGRVRCVYPGPGLAGAVAAPDAPVEPYVLVLGTIEPRKNISVILEFLAAQPHVLTALRFVFLGRHGWGEAPATLLARHGLAAAAEAGRIMFPGYVAAAARDALLARARLMIYPSLFEGFGLPVLEALALGTPVLTTRSSSLMEVGGTVATYFDPFMPGDFGRGLAEALRETPGARTARAAWAAGFSWTRCWRDMLAAIEALPAGEG